MDLLQVVLRLLHIVLGVLWVGAIVFVTIFLMPSIRDVGPDGGKVMGALQRRGMMIYMPVIAMATLVSGFWLYFRDARGLNGVWSSSPTGMAFGVGGVAATIAFFIGLTITRPAVERIGAVAQSLAQAGSDQEKAGLMTELQRLRVRADTANRIISVLVLGTAAAMAVARYL